MIFLTVGGQLPFDRLVRIVDRWAGSRGRRDVFAQIGRSDYRPRHLRARGFLEPGEFQQTAASAAAIVGHAGMGTILTALRFEKPLLVMPRREALGEQRNDHQVATARRFRGLRGVRVAMDEDELVRELDGLDALPAGASIGERASEELLSRLREFVERLAAEKGRG